MARRKNTKSNTPKNKEKVSIEIENKNEINSNKSKKEFTDIIKEYFSVYKNSLKTKHIVCFIIMLVMFGFTMIMYISNLQNQDFLEQVQNITGEYVSPNVFSKILTDKLPIVLIIVIAGITPYLYVSSLGVFFAPQIAEEIIKILSVANSPHNIVLMCIGAIIQFVGLSLAIATGIFWCGISGKRRKYMNGTDKSFLDVKKELYSLTNNKKKLKELEKKRKEKNEKIQKYNVEIPYLTLITSFVISFIIVVIGTFIFYI